MLARNVIGGFCLALVLAFQPAELKAADEVPSLSDIVDAWLASPHADATSESFRHWDEDGEIPASCAACHSSDGYRDFLGADSSAVGQIDHPAMPRSTVDCVACHNPEAQSLATVTFPSGIEVDTLGASSRCAVCHQGRSSTPSLDKVLTGQDPDTPNPELGFVNVHYRAAAATLLGTEAKGGYEYEGKSYAGRFNHVPDLNSCTACHDPHALEVQAESCASCHGAVAVNDIRTSPTDYDGDGDVKEGIAAEVASVHAKLDQTIRDYAATVAGTPIVYAAGRYPYFFVDTNGDGAAGPDEAAYPNRYKGWTPRLLRAAYNYQFVAVDTGAYAHNPKYVMQLMYDSLEDLSQKVEVDLTGVAR
jgi:mono/diheme cytochrome c family protein